MQPWNMRRKLKLVMQAKNYVKKHEGALQERFTQTHSIKNILARWNIYMIKVGPYLNFMVVIYNNSKCITHRNGSIIEEK